MALQDCRLRKSTLKKRVFGKDGERLKMEKIQWIDSNKLLAFSLPGWIDSIKFLDSKYLVEAIDMIQFKISYSAPR